MEVTLKVRSSDEGIRLYPGPDVVKGHKVFDLPSEVQVVSSGINESSSCTLVLQGPSAIILCNSVESPDVRFSELSEPISPLERMHFSARPFTRLGAIDFDWLAAP